MVFLIDLPRIEDPADRATNTLSSFGEELSYFLEAQGVEEKMVRSLRNYNFSETSRYGFVHTIAGYHLEPSVWQRTGYCGLGRTIKALGLDTAEDVELDYICSSIGSLKCDLLAALYGACQGDSGMREYQARTGKTAKNKAATSSADNQPKLSRIRVYYPSSDTVNRSRGGTNVRPGAGRLLDEDSPAKASHSQPARSAYSQSTGTRAHFREKFYGIARMCARVY